MLKTTFDKNIVSLFIKIIQKKGNKELNEVMLRNVFCYIKKTSKQNPLLVFLKAIEKSKPFCEIKSLKISGSNYKIPVEIKSERQKVLILKWLFSNSIKRSDFLFKVNLSKEIVDTVNTISKTIKTCDEFHKMAEANKVFIQFRN